jgi:hypothetical protein
VTDTRPDPRRFGIKRLHFADGSSWDACRVGGTILQPGGIIDPEVSPRVYVSWWMVKLGEPVGFVRRDRGARDPVRGMSSSPLVRMEVLS